MKRTATLLAITALAASPLAAHAGTKPTTRTETWSYNGVSGPSVAGGGFKICFGATSDCFDLSTFKYETKVTFVAKDSSGQKVALQWALDGTYSAGPTNACGEGTVDVKKGSVVNFDTTVDPTCPGIATQGTVTFTITGKK